ncbi:zinc ribbon domain-containing protein [Salsipaludibacter albus]|uniref:zinc ribbon domain-containing protein n=1 Tax=Salsipaludibacter albus TaxID=2849650 RepID=UPI001EE4ACB6|nr:C4-type zinc ribbon domain-containing protein [Salsipaludibacter albus]MBY5163940.1 hypothetical protein [Salsipaludibacter albus]
MPDPSAEQLQALLDLAGTDAAIRRLQNTMDNLPEQQQLADLGERRRALEDQHADIRLERDQVTQVARKHDRDVGQLRERLAHEQQRMYGGDITNAKELGKMEAEISAVQSRIDEHELAELEALETLEEHEEALDALEQELATLSETIRETEERRDVAASGLLAEIAEHEVVRERQRDDLDDELVARYDRSAQRSVGDAVGRLDGEDCTACGIRLSYADVNTLVDGPPLTTCPNCGRLLVVL